MKKIYFFICFILSLALCGFIHEEVAMADVSVAVNYLEETATVTTTGSSIKFYMSTDNKKTWDTIDSSGVVDISSILASKAVTVYFKGNKDTNPVSYTFAAEDSTSLKVTYKITSGEGSINYTVSGKTVEYRKGANGTWKTATSGMSTAIYEIKGATLFFRTVATASTRAGKVVTVKISKRPSAPSVKVDGSKLYITGVKSGETQYRIGDNTAWTTFTAASTTVKTIDLLTLLASTSAVNSVIPASTIEFRTVGSDKKLNSSVKVLNITAQATCPDTITLTGTTISVVGTNVKRYYEYTVVSKTSSLNLSTAKWTSFTSKNSVVAKNVAVGDTILVRLKSTTDSSTKETILASTYKTFTVASITS